MNRRDFHGFKRGSRSGDARPAGEALHGFGCGPTHRQQAGTERQGLLTRRTFRANSGQRPRRPQAFARALKGRAKSAERRLTRPYSRAHRQAGLCQWEVGEKARPVAAGLRCPADSHKTDSPPAPTCVQNEALATYLPDEGSIDQPQMTRIDADFVSGARHLRSSEKSAVPFTRKRRRDWKGEIGDEGRDWGQTTKLENPGLGAIFPACSRGDG